MAADFDVFLSHAWSDKPAVRPIAEALRTAGLRVWIDETEIETHTSITHNIVQGLANSKALVAYYSNTYPARRACQWELTAALIASGELGSPARRVLVLNPEESVTHIQPVELRDALFAKAPSGNETLNEVVANIRRRVRDLEGAMGDIRPLDSPPWYGAKALGSSRFVGRMPELWAIHSGLQARANVLVTGQAGAGVAQVRGMGGIGKSLLAEEYALRFGAAYPGGIFWLRAYGNDDSKEGFGPTEREAERLRQFSDFVVALGRSVENLTPPQIAAVLSAAIDERGKPCLWIIDDLPFGLERMKLESWIPATPKASPLITTRSREYDYIDQNPVNLGVLDTLDAYHLLTSRRKPAGEQEEAAALGIVEDLGRHALAVDVASAALATGVWTFTEYREMLASPDADELELAAELAPQLPSGHDKSVARTFLASINRLDEAGRDFLRLASILAGAPIPVDFVWRVFSAVDSTDERAAQRKAAQSLSQVDTLSLAESGAPDSRPGRTVHTLISRTMRFQKSGADRCVVLRMAAIQVLNRLLGEKVKDPRRHSEIAQELVHARDLVRHAGTTEELNLLGWVGRHDYERGMWASASELFRRQLEGSRGHLGPEHPRTLSAMDNLGATLRALGDAVTSHYMHKIVVEVRRRTLGPQHPATLKSLNNLAVDLRALGDSARALEIHQTVFEARRRTLGPEHPDTIESMNNEAETLQALGDAAGARVIQLQVVELCTRIFGLKHPNTLTSKSNLAETLRDLGDATAARAINLEVFETRSRVLGAEHPLTLITMNNLAATAWAVGDVVAAQEIHQQTVEISRRVLGPEHPNTLSSMGNLAATRLDSGDAAGARDIYEEVDKVRHQVLGPEHPDTIKSKNGLGDALYSLGDLDRARELYEQVFEIHRHTVGLEHAATLNSMNRLAETLRALGDLVRAREIHDQLLDIRGRVLGPEHPDTLQSLNNMAATLHAFGDAAEARNILQQVVQISRRVLGPEHPNTTVAAWNLFSTLTELKDLEAAARVLRDDLRWLLDRDPATLGADLRKIRGYVGEILGGQQPKK